MKSGRIDQFLLHIHKNIIQFQYDVNLLFYLRRHGCIASITLKLWHYLIFIHKREFQIYERLFS